VPRPRRARRQYVGVSRSPIVAGDVILRRISVSPGLGAPVVRLVQVDVSPGLLDVLNGSSSARRPSPLDVPGLPAAKIARNKREAASPARDTASTTSTPSQGVHGGCTVKSDR
jgi:hypothetical protein